MLECTVIDLSVGGACLRFEGDAPTSELFDLTFDAGRTRRACVRRWNAKNCIGAEFFAGSF